MSLDTVAPSQAFAVAFVDTLIRGGLTDVVVSPGSRSQALALELARRELFGELRLHVRIDERESGFLALGLAKGSGQPVLVVTTSGSAVGNLYPSVLEAHHSRVPVIYATADRPEELHGIEANQTTNQADMFGTGLRGLIDVPAAHNINDAVHAGVSAASRAWTSAAGTVQSSGPVHVNVSFREPLSSRLDDAARQELLGQIAEIASNADETDAVQARTDTVTTHDGSFDSLAVIPLDGRPTIVLAGASYGVKDADGQAAQRAAEQLHAPLFAEVVSTARRSSMAMPRPHALLESSGGARLLAECKRIVVFGKPTLHREFVRVLQRTGVDIVVVASRGDDWLHFTADTRRVAGVEITAPIAPSWLDRWKAAAAHQTASAADERSALSAVALVRAVDEATTAVDAVMFAASSLVRVADNVLPHGVRNVFASRGLAGIDGTVSTASGIALGRGRGVTRLVVGDLTLLYGIGGLLTGTGEPLPPLQIVVGNDHGGSIFDNLEVAAADPELFNRVMRTEQSVDLCRLASAYGWEAVQVATRGELQAALNARRPGVIEVVLR